MGHSVLKKKLSKKFCKQILLIFVIYGIMKIEDPQFVQLSIYKIEATAQDQKKNNVVINFENEKRKIKN